VTRSSFSRHKSRQQLILKVEFENATGFAVNYLSDLPKGGVRVHTSMTVGQHVLLSVSIPGVAKPLEIGASVQWSFPASHPDGPAAGLAFLDPSPEARTWLGDVLGAGKQAALSSTPAHRVLLLETQPFLREVYGQEIHNWAELREHSSLDLVLLGELPVWFEEVARAPATLGIVDIDELPTLGLDLYKRVRSDARSVELPLILIGSPQNLEPLSLVSDKLLCCLVKPLKFGLLMTTAGRLARDPSRPGRS
jgi:Tfp pilus assembly protein PilZ